MFLVLNLILLFLLPVVESLNRSTGYVLLFLGGVFACFSLFSRKKIHFEFRNIIFLLILTVFTVSIFNSWSISRSYTELLRYLAYFLVFIAICNYPQPQKIVTRFLIPSIIINSLILSLLALMYYVPILKMPIPVNGMNLFYPVFGHNRIADILIFAIPCSIVLSYSSKKKRNRIIFSLLSIFYVGVLIISLGRGALLSLSFSFFIYLILRYSKNNLEKILSTWAIILGIITIIFLTSSFLYSNIIVQSNNRKKVIPKFYKPVLNDRRLDYASYAMKSIYSFPIFGTGLDTFRYVAKIYQSQPDSWSWYTHNHFLEIFQETGIVGGLLFTLFIVMLIVRSFGQLVKEKENNPLLTTAIFIGVLASAIHSFIDYNWQYLSIFLFFWIGLALLQPETGNLTIIDHKSNFPRIILICFIFLFLPRLFLPLDSDMILQEAKTFINEGKINEAVFLLERAFRLDSAYEEIPKKLAEIYKNNGDNLKAKFWNQIATNLNPLKF